MMKLLSIVLAGLLLAFPVWSQGQSPAVNSRPAVAPLLSSGATDNVVWTQIANAPNVFGRSGTAVLGNYLYVFGSEGYNIAQALNLTTEQWVASTPPPLGNDNWPAVATNNAIYLIGRSGFILNGNEVQRFTPTGSGPTGTWAQMAVYPDTAYGVCGAWDGSNKIYAGGGYSPSTDLVSAYSYNISNNQWTPIADLPEPMGFAGAAFVQGKFHVMGGTSSGQIHYSYNPATNSWTTEAQVPTAIYFATSSVSCNANYIFSVGGGGGYAGWPATNAVQIYNVATGQWTQETPLPVARGVNSAAWVGGGKVISGGGWAPPWTNITYRGTGFPGSGLPNIQVYLTPTTHPVTVPPGGGSFSFTAAAVDSGPQTSGFTVEARIKYPNGTWTPYVLGPIVINPPLNVMVSRLRTQNIPGSYPPGTYYYVGYAVIGMTIVDSTYFTFTKNAVGGSGPILTDASCTGELFPGEIAASIQPSAFSLFGVSPNPFNPTTAISYQLSADSRVSLRVYDTAGRMVTTLVDGWQETGSHQVTFDGSKLASGMYFVRMQAGDFSSTQKMMLMK